jgi:drug/metabolite transporter (DMT)-like permease
MTDMTRPAPAVLPFGARFLTFVLVLLLGACFGLQYAMARLMGTSHVNPIGALFMIHLVLALLFVTTLVSARHTFRLTPSLMLYFGAVALFANVGQLGIELAVARHVTAGELTLIVSLLPMVVLTLAAILRTERLNGRKFLGIILGFASTTALLLPAALEGHSALGWLIITFAAPVSQAIGSIIMARFWPRQLDALQVATGTLLAGTLMLAPAAALTGSSMGFDAALGANGVALLGFGATVAGEFYLFAALTRRGGAVTASCADFAGVLAGLAFGYLFFTEVPTAWMALAAVLCAVALGLTTSAEPQSR